jgi:putative transposase
VQTRDGRKKDGSGNPLTKKGDVFSNIDGGYVQVPTVQLADLKNTNRLFPDYKLLDGQVLQDVVHPVETSFPNFTTPDKNGNRRGKPKFKGFHYYKSLTYPQLDNLNIIKDEQNRIGIDLGKVGQVPMVFQRSIPKGFKVKTGTVIPEPEADGWHISLTIEYQRVPVTVAEIQQTAENIMGIGLGIANYVYLSNGEQVENQRVLRASAEKLARLQAKLASKVKGSKPGNILKGKISKLHPFVARASRDFPFKTAHKLFDKCDVVVVEELSLKNWTRRAPVKTDIEDGNLVYLPNGQAAKSGLNKSILDAAQGQFTTVIKYVAGKLGKSVVFVDPKGTFQCGNCLYKGPKELSARWHSCQCRESWERDENLAKPIKKIGLNYDSGGASTSLKKALAWREKEACALTVRP